MLINDIIVESQIDPGLEKVLTKQGYKLMGAGIDQQAWLEPGTGLIMKIFGYSHRNRSHKSFFAFAKVCQDEPNNPFLPQISGWEEFNFKGKRYLKIHMERLFPLDGDLREAIEDLVSHTKSNRGINSFIDDYLDRHSEWGDKNRLVYGELISLLGEQGIRTLWKTISRLSVIANEQGLVLDLHGGNFMHGSDGQIVISDPFVV